MRKSDKEYHFLRHLTLEENPKGEITITFTPKELEILGVKEGDWVNFQIEQGQIIITKTKPKRKKSTKRR